MKVLIYDIEIEKAIPSKKETPISGIEYCQGWDDHKGMGISVCCAYDYAEDRYRVFDRMNVQRFYEFTRTHLMVGFNNIGFDNKVIQEVWNLPVETWKNYDILGEIWVGEGLDRKYKYPSHVGYGLDAVCGMNFGKNKSGHGALAPVDWQQGRIADVIDYCLEDVRLTKKVFDLILEKGEIVSPKNRDKRIKIAKPTIE